MSTITDVKTATQLKSLLKAGATTVGAYRVHPEASGTGLLDIGVKSPDVAIFDIQPGWTWVGAQGSANPAVSVHCRNVELYGGDVSNPHGGIVGVGGGDGVKVTDSAADGGKITCRWWGLYVHDCALGGFSSQANVYEHALDMQYETARCGLNIHLDPHTEKGTGVHGTYIGGGSKVTSGRFRIFAHDQPTGAGVQCGAYCDRMTLEIAGARMTWPKASAGAVFQPWGHFNGTVRVVSLSATDCNYGIWSASLSSGAWTVENYTRGVCKYADYLKPYVHIAP